MNQDRTKRKLTAILSTDVVGYSRLMEADESWTIQTLEENKSLISELVEEYKGRVVDATGDNLLAEFISVINAVECAVKIQQELKIKNDRLIEEDRRMNFRIGVNLGDVVEEDGRIYGSGVNIASRLEGLAEPGGICISGRTYDHIKTKLGLGYKYIGEQNVKNISEPIRIYRLLMGSENAGKVIGERKALSRKSYRTAIAAIIILIIIAAVSIWWNIGSYKTGVDGIITEHSPVTSDVKQIPKTIAVLPFDDFSPDKDQEYFVNGLSEEILNTIAQISDLTVISRTSSFLYKGSNKKIQEIADDLGVANILEGSVRKAGNTIRITAQLIKAEDESHLWSKIYDRELKNAADILTIQEDIAASVADELKGTLGIGKSFKLLGGTDNLEAYELYMVAKGLFNSRKIERAQKSINEAIKLDPGYALAWALKGMFQLVSALTGPVDLVFTEIENGLDSARKAIELEPDLGKGYLALGSAHMVRGEYIEAEKAYRKGMTLTNESIDYFHYGLTSHYTVVGYFKKSFELLSKIRQNDPLNLGARTGYLFSLALLGDNERTEKEYKLIKAIWGDDRRNGLFIAISRLGAKNVISINDIPESLRIESIWKILIDHIESPEEVLNELRLLYSRDNELSVDDIEFLACIAAHQGDPEFALSAMEKSINLQGTGFNTIWFPVMREVRQLPRFKELVKEKGLVDYWREYGWPDLCRPLGDDDLECD